MIRNTTLGRYVVLCSWIHEGLHNII